MKRILLISAFLSVFSFGCTPTAPTAGAVMSPIKAVGCNIETAVSTGFANAVAAALTCSNVSAVQTSLQTAFGNANLCVAQASVDLAKKAALEAKVSGKPALKGIIGNIACPMAISAAMGYLTATIPAAWGCSASATTSAAAIATALTTACETAVPL